MLGRPIVSISEGLKLKLRSDEVDNTHRTCDGCVWFWCARSLRKHSPAQDGSQFTTSQEPVWPSLLVFLLLPQALQQDSLVGGV